ncbi:MAG: hypothetical protein WC615_09390 [Mucilaginibacter sp.]|jgi:hypothetical protein|uniref:hypothetical protein n=1 Tax=Mucilaginibacter sp. TaxID=1882438 RepID=UPI003564A976
MRYKKTSLRLFSIINCYILMMMLWQGKAIAQSKPTGGKDIVSKIEQYQARLPSEKLHLVLDKPNYFAGDTLWFKVYLVNASNRQPSLISNKVYVELINDSSRVTHRLLIPVVNGLGEGDFKLPANGLRDGGYTLRAYTNWMQNFGEEQFFHKRFYIGDDSKNNWLISEQHSVKTTPGGKEVTLAVQLNDTKNSPVMYTDVQLLLVNGNKTVFKKAFTTSDQGTFKTSWALPANADTRNLKLVLQNSTDKKTRQSFPFYPGGETQNIDVQFMPEGGNLIAGLLNKIAFKAIGEDGLGINVSGVIVDSKNREVGGFQSAHNGIGNFRMVPLANEVYRAQVKYAGNIKTIALPQVNAKGIGFRIDNISKADTINIYISATADIAAQNKTYSLVSQAKDTIYFGTAFNLNKGYYNVSLPKSKFVTGIVNFTVFDDAGTPLNERKVFIDRHDRLAITPVTHKLTYQPKDSVAIAVTVLNPDGSPARNSVFTAAVTDDAQVKTSAYGNNILSSMLLASELKGNIEEPGWYFAGNNAETTPALDDLLLTQGWTGFNWDNLAHTIKEPRFLPETGNMLSGSLYGMFKKPIDKAKVTLLLSNKETLMVMDTVSGKNGRFVFDNIPYLDSVIYTVKVNNKKGSTFGGEVVVDEIKQSSKMPLYTNPLMPWFVNTDNTLLKYYENNTANKQASEKIALGDVKGTLLGEVKVNAKRTTTLKDANGDDIDFYDALIDEKQLIKAGRQNLYDYLLANQKGFKVVSGYRGNPNSNFLMNGNPVIWFIIDGINVARFYTITDVPNNHFNFLKSYLTGMLAADVKQMVVYHSYSWVFKDVLAYLVIQTRGGNGPATSSPSGIYVYRPETAYKARQFYKPRYTVNNTYDNQVNRTTIHWEPSLITDENGKATLSFYTADKPSTYTVNLEGTDMLGHFGVQTLKLKVDNKPVN